MNAFTIIGKWWLPEDSNNIESGTLYFDSKTGPTLELNGSFKEMKDLSKRLNPKIILGVTIDSKLITLYKCYEKTTKTSFPGYTSSIYLVDVIFQNCHFKKEEDIQFNSISINYSFLEQWMNESGIKYKYKINKGDNSLKEYDLKYGYPKTIEVNIDDIRVYL